MKFKDLKGNEVAKDISSYKRERNRVGASKGERKLGDELDRLFPGLIYQEFLCVGTRLRLDFYVHLLKVAFEFDGTQHDTYVPHFHGSRAKFQAARARDWDKEQWCEINGIRLIRVNDDNLDSIEELIRER
jgi:very-short-patch-repair endonuclease